MKCKWKDQQPQTNDFILLNGELETKQTLPVGATCFLDQQRFQLFRQAGNQAAFLSDAPLAPLDLSRFDQSEINTNVHQAWQKSPQEAFDNENPLLITASLQNLPTAMDMANRLRQTHKLRVLLETDKGLPFAVQPARFMWPNFPPEAMGASKLLEDWGIPNRLISVEFIPGCFQGTLSELLNIWSVPSDWQSCHLDSLL